MRVYWTAEARIRLSEIEAYIAKESPMNASEVVARLVLRSRDLVVFPNLGRSIPEYPQTNLRELLHRPFRLVYRVTAEQVEIMTVMHFRQLLPRDWRDLIGH